MTDRQTKCDNCGKTWGWQHLADIGKGYDNLSADALKDRLDPGGEVPAGECPECGALCYLVKTEPRPLAKAANHAQQVADRTASMLSNDGTPFETLEGLAEKLADLAMELRQALQAEGEKVEIRD